MVSTLVVKIAIWGCVRNVLSFTASHNHVLVEKLSLDHLLSVVQSFLNVKMFVKKSWIVGINVKKFVIMENANVLKKLLLNVDVENKISKPFVEEKLYV